MSYDDQVSQDPVILAIIGKFFKAESIEIATFYLIYGIFVLVFAQSTAIFLRKHLSSRAHMYMFLTSASSFILATVQGIALLADAWITAQTTLVKNQDASLAERLQLAGTSRRTPTLLLVWTCAFGPVITDTIVIWRAFVLLKTQFKRWLIILPLLLLLGSIATSLANAILAVMGGDIDTGVINTTYTLGLRLSLATNVVATALIGYIYWLHRRDTEVLSRRPTQTVRVLAVFFESGVAFCMPQAIYVFLNLVPSGDLGTIGESIRHVFTMAYFAFAWMYPTVVIVLVNRQYTLDNYLFERSLPSMNYYPTGPNRTVPPRPISFARPGPAASLGE